VNSLSRFITGVSPELTAALDNLRKLSKLSGSGQGCSVTITELPDGISVNVTQREARRGKLLENLYGCDSAISVELDGNSNPLANNFTVTDPLNKVGEQWDALEDSDGDLYIPAGTCFDSHFRSDTQQYELDTIGLCCIGSGSEGSEQEGSEGSEGSEQEGSEQGSGPICYPVTGMALNFPTLASPALILGQDANGCWGWVPTTDCQGSGSGGGMMVVRREEHEALRKQLAELTARFERLESASAAK
jgi:hypothetical protein